MPKSQRYFLSSVISATVHFTSTFKLMFNIHIHMYDNDFNKVSRLKHECLLESLEYNGENPISFGNGKSWGQMSIFVNSGNLDIKFNFFI